MRLAGSAGVSGNSSPGASCFLPRSSTVERILACRMLTDSCAICRPHVSYPKLHSRWGFQGITNIKLMAYHLLFQRPLNEVAELGSG